MLVRSSSATRSISSSAGYVEVVLALMVLVRYTSADEFVEVVVLVVVVEVAVLAVVVQVALLVVVLVVSSSHTPLEHRSPGPQGGSQHVGSGTHAESW